MIESLKNLRLGIMDIQITNSDDNIYGELRSEVEAGLVKIEGNPESWDTKLKSVEIALTVLKNGVERTVNMERYKSHWDYKAAVLRAFGPLALTLLLGAPSTISAIALIAGVVLNKTYKMSYKDSCRYSHIGAHIFIRNTFNDLLKDDQVINSNLLRCTIKVNTANRNYEYLFDYWTFFKDVSTEVCSHDFSRGSTEIMVI
jgi:hypothetical protein